MNKKEASGMELINSSVILSKLAKIQEGSLHPPPSDPHVGNMLYPWHPIQRLGKMSPTDVA
jgi:hypothetical protein